MIKVLLAFFFISCVFSQKLLSLQHVTRHGIRNPKPSSSDVVSKIFEQFDVEGDGELTLGGKYMHYVLGRIAYNHYWQQLFAGTPYETTFSRDQL